jgi:NAD-dependent deacetylase
MDERISEAAGLLARAKRVVVFVRPGVVWFGEPLPEDAFADAVERAASCDLLITVGTSGVVYPAAEIPQVASRFGAPVIQVNPQPTPLDAIATINLHGPAAEILPRLMDLRRHA